MNENWLNVVDIFSFSLLFSLVGLVLSSLFFSLSSFSLLLLLSLSSLFLSFISSSSKILFWFFFVCSYWASFSSAIFNLLIKLSYEVFKLIIISFFLLIWALISSIVLSLLFISSFNIEILSLSVWIWSSNLFIFLLFSAFILFIFSLFFIFISFNSFSWFDLILSISCSKLFLSFIILVSYSTFIAGISFL